MSIHKRYQVPSVGVEEEYQLVDPQTGHLIPNCKQVMRHLQAGSHPPSDAEIHHELHLNQIEMASRVCQTLDEVRSNLCEVRGLLIEASRQAGTALVSAGTNPAPLPETDTLTPKDRYRVMSQQYQHLARELYIFGCHVHVTMADEKLGVSVMNQSRRWLPALQALTANSPFWDGEDTGYASYRRELWAQWPMAGPPPHFTNLADYRSCMSDLIQAGAIRDESFIYWDIRLPTKVPTIEFRAADGMTLLEDTVGYVGLVRAIVMQTAADVQAGLEHKPIRANLLSYTVWHAARYGVAQTLIDPLTCETLPAAQHLEHLMHYLQPALEAAGDHALVQTFVDRTLTNGCGADRQRAAATGEQPLVAVMRQAIEQTAAGTPHAVC